MTDYEASEDFCIMYITCELCGNEVKIVGKTECFTCPECGAEQNV